MSIVRRMVEINYGVMPVQNVIHCHNELELNHCLGDTYIKYSFLKIHFIWLCWVFVAALGLPLDVVHRLLTVAASLIVKNGL